MKMSSLLKSRIIDHELCVCEYGLWTIARSVSKTLQNQMWNLLNPFVFLPCNDFRFFHPIPAIGLYEIPFRLGPRPRERHHSHQKEADQGLNQNHGLMPSIANKIRRERSARFYLSFLFVISAPHGLLVSRLDDFD